MQQPDTGNRGANLEAQTILPMNGIKTNLAWWDQQWRTDLLGPVDPSGPNRSQDELLVHQRPTEMVAAILKPTKSPASTLLQVVQCATMTTTESRPSSAPTHAPTAVNTPQPTPIPNPISGSSPNFIASVDTMNDSMNTSAPQNQLTDTAIASDVNLTASMHTTHITVDVFMNYPDYMRRWVNAVRATGKHVWFRVHFNAWEGNNGVAATMTPAQYVAAEDAFIKANSALFQAGDVADFCPEAENGKYWVNTYGTGWASTNPPNAATDEFNRFQVAVMDTADADLHAAGIYGVITTIRATNSWWPLHPKSYYPSTIARMGEVTIDTYPDSGITDPTLAAQARVNEMQQVWNVVHVPVIVGEMGYDIKNAVDDQTQENVISAELKAMAQLPFWKGVNYWVGAGFTSNTSRLFDGTRGNWSLRPAAYVLADFYALRTDSVTPLSTPSINDTPALLPASSPQACMTTLPTPTPPSGKTVTVATDGSGNYETINQAVAALGTQGGTILVKDGTYTPASINSDTWLLGQGNNVLIQTPAGSTSNALDILNAQNVRVSQIRVAGNWNGTTRTNFTGRSYIDGNGIRIYNSSGVYIDHNYATNAWYGGITIDTSNNITLTNNLVEKNGDNNIFLRPNNTHVDIEYNTSRNAGYSGIQCLRSDYVTIAYNTSYQNGPSQAQGDGAGSEGCRYTIISNNTLYGNNPQGVKVDYTVEGGSTAQRSFQVSVTNNMIYDQTVSNNAGIFIDRADQTFVSGNIINNNYYGINIGPVGETTIQGNVISNSSLDAIRAYNVNAIGPIIITNNIISPKNSSIVTDSIPNVQQSGNIFTDIIPPNTDLRSLCNGSYTLKTSIGREIFGFIPGPHLHHPIVQNPLEPSHNAHLPDQNRNTSGDASRLYISGTQRAHQQVTIFTIRLSHSSGHSCTRRRYKRP